MSIEEYRADALRCTRCSHCKWIPFDLMKGHRFAKGCPSVEAGGFHAYSAGGRLITLLSLSDGRSEITDKVVDSVFRCQLCGNCDVACKMCRYDMEPLAAMYELREHLAAAGRLPEAYASLLPRACAAPSADGGAAAARNAWADGLGLADAGREPVDVLFFAGCTYSHEPSLRDTVRTAAQVLLRAGLTVGILPETGCCGGLADKMGLRDEAWAAGERMLAQWSTAGVTTVVTPCADCYHTFKRRYPELGSRVEVLHTVEMVDRLIKDGRLALTQPVPMTVTYHDPCHLGRQGEPYVAWQGVEKKIYGQAVVYDPPRPRYNGAQGIYDAPRDVLAAIPGLELVEMERNREGAWCCGAGGACREAYPAYSAATAAERLVEAAATGADAIVSACSRCEANFSEGVAASAAAGNGNAATAALQVYDVLELVARAAGEGREAS